MDAKTYAIFKKLSSGSIPQNQIDEIAAMIGISTPSNLDTISNNIDEIIANSNQTTGESDTTLTDAVQSLIDGYGGGGEDATKQWLIDYIGYNLSGEVTIPPEITRIDGGSNSAWHFYANSKITKLTIPNTVAVWNLLRIQGLNNLMHVTLSCSATSVPIDAFYLCPNLKTVDITSDCGILSTSNYMFEKCVNLEAVIIRKSSVVQCSNNKLFADSTKMLNGTGFVYVPRDLLSAYQNETNWAASGASFRAIEDYPEITGG